MEQTNSSSLKYIKAKEGDRQEISKTNIIMTKETIRIGIDQTVEIEEFHSVIGYNVDDITYINQSRSEIVEMTPEEVTLEVI